MSGETIEFPEIQFHVATGVSELRRKVLIGTAIVVIGIIYFTSPRLLRSPSKPKYVRKTYKNTNTYNYRSRTYRSPFESSTYESRWSSYDWDTFDWDDFYRKVNERWQQTQSGGRKSSRGGQSSGGFGKSFDDIRKEMEFLGISEADIKKLKTNEEKKSFLRKLRVRLTRKYHEAGEQPDARKMTDVNVALDTIETFLGI